MNERDQKGVDSTEGQRRQGNQRINREMVKWRKPQPGFRGDQTQYRWRSGYKGWSFGSMSYLYRDENGVCLGVLAVPGAGFTHVEVEGNAQCVFAALDSTIEYLSVERVLVDEVDQVPNNLFPVM
ncbi:hypothetical protein ACLB2K_036764 [Fragaria x ananassa]